MTMRAGVVKSFVVPSKDVQGSWIEQDPSAFPPESVLVAVSHSGLNYKDALSLTGKAPISRAFPMVPGVDLVGTVIDDQSGTFAKGDVVVATGNAVGEKYWGAYSEQARMKPEWLMRVPEGLTAEQAAAAGTAGLTAAMAVEALERYGIAPDAGTVLLTGATGGVGSFASLLLKAGGYRIAVATGRDSEAEYLTANGASEIIPRAELEGEPRPLAKERWRAAIDVVGGNVLANILSSIQYGGAVAACGLAGSMALPTSVAPFILRGVALLGIDSVMASTARRERAWARLAKAAPDLPFERIITRHHFGEVRELADRLLAQELRGKVVLHW
jgi:acrylyl-CoA reductase (NADPH)